MTIRLYDKRTLLTHPFVRISETAFAHRRSDGSWGPVTKRVNMDRGDAAAVLIHTIIEGNHTLVLVKQFRFATYDPDIETAENGWLVELVAGIVNDHEPPAVTAQREGGEETGLSVAQLEHISSFYLSPGGSPEKIHLFYGQAIAPEDGLDLDAVHGVDDEETLIVTYSPQEFLDAVDNNQIEDAKTMLAAAWVRAHPDKFGL